MLRKLVGWLRDQQEKGACASLDSSRRLTKPVVVRLKLEPLEDRTLPASLTFLDGSLTATAHQHDYALFNAETGDSYTVDLPNAEYPEGPIHRTEIGSEGYFLSGNISHVAHGGTLSESSLRYYVRMEIDWYIAHKGRDIQQSYQAEGSISYRIGPDFGESNGYAVNLFLGRGFNDADVNITYEITPAQAPLGTRSGSVGAEGLTVPAQIGDVVTYKFTDSGQHSSTNVDERKSYYREIILGMPGVELVVPEVRVQAQWDDVGTKTDDTFGTYLAGVKLPTDFTVKVTNAPEVARVRFQVDSTVIGTQSYNPSSATGVVFSYDPGQLRSGNHYLIVRPLDEFNKPVGDPFVGTIKVIERLFVHLQADVPGQGLVDASSLRLLAGAANLPNLNFTATVSNLPLQDAYAGRLAMRFLNKGSTQFIHQFPMTFSAGAGTFSVPMDSFGNVVANPSLFDYDVYLTPTDDTKLATVPFRLNAASDPTAHLFVTGKPAWLKNAVLSYASDNAIQTALGASTGGYAFKLSTPVSFNLPVTKGTPFALFDGLKSGVTARFDIFLFARLTANSGDVVLKSGDWDLKVTLLDDQIFSQQFTPGESGISVTADGTISPKLLTGASRLVLRTSQSVDLFALLPSVPAIDQTFGDGTNGTRKWSITGLPVPLTGGLLTSKFYLNGAFQAALKSLLGNVQLTFAPINGVMVLNKKASWVQLDLKAGAQLTMHAGMSVTPLSVLGVDFDLFRASVQGTADMELNTRFRMMLAGPTGVPALNAAASYAGLLVAYDLKYAVEFLASGEPDPASFEPLGSASKNLRLFGLALPPVTP